jgi:hypothetical protein
MVRSSRRRVHLAPGREALVRCCLVSNLGLHAIRLMTTSAVDHDKTGVVEFFNCPRWWEAAAGWLHIAPQVWGVGFQAL